MHEASESHTTPLVPRKGRRTTQDEAFAEELAMKLQEHGVDGPILLFIDKSDIEEDLGFKNISQDLEDVSVDSCPACDMNDVDIDPHPT